MLRSLLFALAMVGLVLPAAAQDLPQKSPRCTITQQVGLTKFSLDFSRPSARDREVFGEVVPFGKLWRTGANMATSIEFDTEVMVDGQPVPAGKYAIFTIPREGGAEWTFILNKTWRQGGTSDYKEADDVLRLEVPVTEVPFTETMMLNLVDLHAEGATLQLSWANMALRIPLTVDVAAQAEANIEKEVDNIWMSLARSGRYYLDAGYNYERGLELMTQSVQHKTHYWNTYHKALLHEKLGQKEMAQTAAARAMELGEATEPGGWRDSWDNFYRGQVEQLLDRLN